MHLFDVTCHSAVDSTESFKTFPWVNSPLYLRGCINFRAKDILIPRLLSLLRARSDHIIQRQVPQCGPYCPVSLHSFDDFRRRWARMYYLFILVIVLECHKNCAYIFSFLKVHQLCNLVHTKVNTFTRSLGMMHDILIPSLFHGLFL